jgi:hypothetical protein
VVQKPIHCEEMPTPWRAGSHQHVTPENSNAPNYNKKTRKGPDALAQGAQVNVTAQIPEGKPNAEDAQDPKQ